MSNVIKLNVPSRFNSAEDREAALLCSFAGHRRFGDDVFWLKENAEVLNVLESTGARPTQAALEAHMPFYASVEKRLSFFPQYYRFLLSITLDLEELGVQGDKGDHLCAWISREGLPGAELSDLQRMEAKRLLARRGVDAFPKDKGLEDRMREFISRSATFSMPNKKAAYELTHTIFYLSEYGRKDPELSEEAIASLHYAGLLALLDQNADLLAEICVAMRHANQTPPRVWEDWLERRTHRFEVQTGDSGTVSDDYHAYLVCNWALASAGRDAFVHTYAPERMCFLAEEGLVAPLRDMSQVMFQLDEQRSGDWTLMRSVIEENMSEPALDVLTLAETSTPHFEAFFEGFARTGQALPSGMAFAG